MAENKWVTGVTTLLIRVKTRIITARGPPGWHALHRIMPAVCFAQNVRSMWDAEKRFARGKKRGPEKSGKACRQDRQKRKSNSHRIHVWYICLHHKNQLNVGKYTIYMILWELNK